MFKCYIEKNVHESVALFYAHITRCTSFVLLTPYPSLHKGLGIVCQVLLRIFCTTSSLSCMTDNNNLSHTCCIYEV